MELKACFPFPLNPKMVDLADFAFQTKLFFLFFFFTFYNYILLSIVMLYLCPFIVHNLKQNKSIECCETPLKQVSSCSQSCYNSYTQLFPHQLMQQNVGKLSGYSVTLDWYKVLTLETPFLNFK